jgi:C4-dicarboxylate-specific signal transduction histidine kinase
VILLLASLAFVGLRAWPLFDGRNALVLRAQFVADSIDRTLRQRMITTFTLAALPSLRGFAASDEDGRAARAAVARVELQAIVDADPNVRSASVVDAAGTVVLATDSSMRENWCNRRWVREAVAGQLFASSPLMDRGEISQFYTAPILNNSGAVAGVLAIRVAVQELWDAFGEQNDMLLIDENGVRIADRSQSPLLFVAIEPIPEEAHFRLLDEEFYGSEIPEIRATNLPALAQAVRDERQTSASYRDQNGRNVHAVIVHTKVKPWAVVAFEVENAIVQRARESAGVIGAVGAGILIAAGLALELRHRTSRTN